MREHLHGLIADFLLLLLAGAVMHLQALCQVHGHGGIAGHEQVERIQRVIHAACGIQTRPDAE